MQFLNQELTRQKLTMLDAISAIEKLLEIQHKQPNWVKCPDRLVIPTHTDNQNVSTGSHLSMPSVVFDGNNEYAAIKLVTICPDNPAQNLPTTTAIILVSDTKTGEILSIMDGVYITQLRTAALSAIATKHLAKKEAKIVAVIGCGGMAYEQLNAVLTVRPDIKTIYLWNRTVADAQVFAEKFQANYAQWQQEIVICEDIETATTQADIINLATRANTGLFEASQIKADVHINAIGAYLPEMKEVSDSVIESCEFIVIDDIHGGKSEAGDLIQSHQNDDCNWSWDKLSGDLVSLHNQQLNIPQGFSGRTLFKSVGAASFDAAVAIELALKANQQSLEQSLSLF